MGLCYYNKQQSIILIIYTTSVRIHLLGMNNICDIGWWVINILASLFQYILCYITRITPALVLLSLYNYPKGLRSWQTAEPKGSLSIVQFFSMHALDSVKVCCTSEAVILLCKVNFYVVPRNNLKLYGKREFYDKNRQNINK